MIPGAPISSPDAGLVTRSCSPRWWWLPPDSTIVSGLPGGVLMRDRSGEVGSGSLESLVWLGRLGGLVGWGPVGLGDLAEPGEHGDSFQYSGR